MPAGGGLNCFPATSWLAGAIATWAAPQPARISIIPPKNACRIVSPVRRAASVPSSTTMPKASRSRRRSAFTFDMEGLGGDQPVAVDAMVAEVVDIDDRVDPDAHLDQRLAVGRDVDQENLFLARRVLRRRRRRAGQS